ncbi:dipeptidase [Aminirod propionatiphilus]|uniref:C69 family dipeptidase n=1 Tax=Aminirod propionatiphilus TaxID=3415223 RepID=A0ACD1DXF3_9BACT|nr:C69 family dipeptidase [Synergistota bacterium]
MRRKGFPAVLLLFFWVLGPGLAEACTTIIVTRGASKDGSVMVSHSDDNDLSDQRIVYVPAQDYAPGSMRPVYCSAVAMGDFPEYNSYGHRRMVAPERAPAYGGEGEPSIPLGQIPQVPHTYAYFDGNYGIMNEHQLLFGECTDGSKVTPGPEPGRRILYSSELSRIALERCRTAREAIALMGDLIERYGLYGTGETLPVADREEGWVMEMAPSPDGEGGLWVAKKVPDGEVFVAANQFRIRQIDPDDPDVMFSKNLHEVARRHGWWNPEEGPLDWLRTVSLGEYNHPYYSLRRVWRVFSLIAPSKGFSPWVEDGFTAAYPFSVRPDAKLDVRDVMALHRDHYEGTEFDLTRGVAAGPFGYPDRFYGPYDGAGDVGDPSRRLDGAWERPLSVTYCGYAFVAQARSWLPDEVGGLLWLGLDKPSDTVFIPYHAGLTGLPESVEVVDTARFSRESAWWAFNFLSNYAGLKYSYMHAEIVELREELEKGFLQDLAVAERRALALLAVDAAKARAYLTELARRNTADTLARWWGLADHLIVKYNDGLLNEEGKMGQPLGYPRDWLSTTSWPTGPTTYERR